MSYTSDLNILDHLKNPSLYFDAISVSRRTASFVQLEQSDLDRLSQIPFRGWGGGEDRPSTTAVSWNRLLADPDLQSGHSQPIHHIFTTPYSGTTLLCRLVGSKRHVRSYCEPYVFLQLQDIHNTGKLRTSVQLQLQELALSLFSRAQREDSLSVVKHTCTSTVLGSSFLRLRQKSRAILLHSSLRTFLIQCLKKQSDPKLDRRPTTRLRMTQLLGPAGLKRIFGHSDPKEAPDGQLAAFRWLTLIRNMEELRSSFEKKVQLIRTEELMNSPVRTLERVLAFIGASKLKSDEVPAIDQILAEHAKDPSRQRRFSPEMWQESLNRSYLGVQDEVHAAEDWASQAVQGFTAFRS